jgi:acyl-CoA thioesterase
MRIRDTDLDASPHSPAPAAAQPFGAPPQIEGKSQLIPLIEVEAFHMAVDIRLPALNADHALWMRLRYPLVEGEVTSPFARTATLADWTYSVPIIAREIRDGKILKGDRNFATINPDAGIHIHRSPRGPWICFNSEVHYGARGAGTASAQIFDDVGQVGHTSQVILIRPAELQKTIHDS